MHISIIIRGIMMYPCIIIRGVNMQILDGSQFLGYDIPRKLRGRRTKC